MFFIVAVAVIFGFGLSFWYLHGWVSPGGHRRAFQGGRGVGVVVLDWFDIVVDVDNDASVVIIIITFSFSFSFVSLLRH